VSRKIFRLRGVGVGAQRLDSTNRKFYVLNLLFLCSPKEKVAKRKGVFPPRETSMFQAAAAAVLGGR